MIWMISANGKLYDYASSFATNGFIDWRQRAKYNIGDIVYIYCTRPLMRVMYKCEVVRHSVPFSECVDDAKFWLDHNEYEKSKVGNYARLKLLAQVDTMSLSLEALKNNGLNAAPQGPIKVSPELNAYIEKHFNDCYSEGFFHDISTQEQYHEGHVRSVLVDKYERSSIARGKCIEFHGPTCLICGLNFGEKYGSLGEGFIHVHHLKPLSTIRKDYVVDYKNDLIPVCPNCHAMIHRIPGGESMTISQIKMVLNRHNDNNAIVEQQISIVANPVSFKNNSTQESKESLIKRRVHHTSPKFGPGFIQSETDVAVTIVFDNGITTSFVKESFGKGLLVLDE